MSNGQCQPDSNNNIAVSIKNSNLRKTLLGNILIIIEIGLLYKIFSNMPNWNVEKLILKKLPYDHNIKNSVTKIMSKHTILTPKKSIVIFFKIHLHQF
jgi:hypothetical protein